MASDFEKPDKIHTLYPEEIKSKLWPLPVSSLFGCGRKTAERLTGMGVRTIGELAEMDLGLLKSILGNKSAEYLYNNANGISTSPVTGIREKAKSYSNETTTSEDISDANYESIGLPIVRRLADSVARRLKADGVRAFTVYVIVKTSEFARHTRQTTLMTSTNDPEKIRETAEQLMYALLYGPEGLFSGGVRLRLIGVGCSNVDRETFRQMDLFSWAETRKAEEQKREEEKKKEQDMLERKKKLDGMMEQVWSRYGEESLRKGIQPKATE